MQVRVEVLQVLRLAGIDVARNVEVAVVGRALYLGPRHHARVARHLELPIEHVHDAVDVLGAQAVLVAVLDEAPTGVDHEDAAVDAGVLLVDDQDARRDAGAVEEIGGQADDALDEAAPDEVAANVRLPVATKEDAVGQDDRALSSALQRRDQMQEECVVAVLGRRDAVGEAPVPVVGRIEAAGPRLGREGRIGDGEVERLEAAFRVREVGGGQRVAAPQVGGRMVVQDHVHPRQRPGRVVHLLAVDGDAVRRLVRGLEQQ